MTVKDFSIPSIRERRLADMAVVASSIEPEMFYDVEQGSDEWFRLRLGLPTASNFSSIMASGRDGGDSKMRAKLLRQLAGERLTGETAEQYNNAYMQRGKEMEAEARSHFSFSHNVELTRVGFIRREFASGRYVGCSPDSLIGSDGILEIKTMAPHLMIDIIESGRIPTEHRAQCHGSLWVSNRKFCELVIYYRGMPVTPTFLIHRDETYIHEIAEAVEIFDYELRRLVDRIKNTG